MSPWKPRSSHANKAFVTSLYAMAMALGYAGGGGVARGLLAVTSMSWAFVAAGGLGLVATALVAARLDRDTAELHVLPTLWFRNTWAWTDDEPDLPQLELDGAAIRATHPTLGRYELLADDTAEGARVVGAEAREVVDDGRHRGLEGRVHRVR